MKVEFDIPQEEKSIIKVIGVGGGGCNAVNFMYEQGIVGVDFAICNTDNQSLIASPVPRKIQLGPSLTEGRGAGSKPEVGKQACIESIEEVKEFLEDSTKMLFIAAGMGGGTGTGAAPVIAKVAQELGILTIGIVTVPFGFEGKKKKNYALAGIEELQAHVDASIVISNNRLREIFGNLSLSEAFKQADNILATAAKGIAEIITISGSINVDFEDVNTVMRDSGIAIMGTAQAEGDNRAMNAVKEALNSPLLEDNDIRGAKDILLNISSGAEELTMDEVGVITDYIIEEAGEDINLIWGYCVDQSLDDRIMVTLIATGFDQSEKQTQGSDNQSNKYYENSKIIVSLDSDVEEDEEVVQEEIPFASNEATASGVSRQELSRPSVERAVKSRYVNPEPYFKESVTKQEEPFGGKPVSERTGKDITTNDLSELENMPAYLRRKVRLENVPKSGDFKRSTMVVNTEGDLEVRDENPYLYDNVD